MKKKGGKKRVKKKGKKRRSSDDQVRDIVIVAGIVKTVNSDVKTDVNAVGGVGTVRTNVGGMGGMGTVNVAKAVDAVKVMREIAVSPAGEAAT